ncbi:MAG: adenosylcobinamide-GDP ribazoletransferase [Selenomonadaceae bacterium]|nr:adenosylcobinamide-GDP ribazoletransferase [Selenomonadaceae bacterium]
MDAFLIGLQFLTRITIKTQTEWTEENFGKSVKYFPLIGAVVGLIAAALTGFFFVVTGGKLPILAGAIAFTLPIIITGGIHCDGFMDSVDGLFSGREREKILEIMKDSRVGAFGAVGLVLLATLEVATLIELLQLSIVWSLAAIFSAPIISRLMMVVTIGKFPYARREGMGKAFAKYTTRRTIFFALIETVLIFVPLIFFDVKIFLTVIFAAIISLGFTFYFGNFAIKKIGGVTGDIYGAVSTLVELIVLIIFLFTALNFNPNF